MIQRSRLQLAMQRHRLSHGEALDEQRMRDELRESANDEVRAAFLIDAIAEKEKVEVTDADLEKRLAEMAQSARQERAASQGRAAKRRTARLLRHQLREEKTLDLLLSRAKINEKAKDASSSSET